MDPRIADYIRDNRRRYTREAIFQQLIDAGYTPEAIQATWAALEMPDPDSTVGEGFWSRFWLYLIGANVVVFLGVVLLTGMLGSGGGPILAVILGIALAIGALIAWGIVAATGPAKMGRGTALAVGAIIPLAFALLIGGSCYALVGGLGVGGPAPLAGTMEITIEKPEPFVGSGVASCSSQPDGFGVFADEVGRLDGRPINVSIDVRTAEAGELLSPNLTIYLLSGSADQQEIGYASSPSSQVVLDPGAGAFAGSLTFTDLARAEAIDPSASSPAGLSSEPISGTITWQCK
jgi:hypothetical protein